MDRSFISLLVLILIAFVMDDTSELDDFESPVTTIVFSTPAL
jgi:hypothetical protein